MVKFLLVDVCNVLWWFFLNNLLVLWVVEVILKILLILISIGFVVVRLVILFLSLFSGLDYDVVFVWEIFVIMWIGVVGLWFCVINWVWIWVVVCLFI